MTSRSLRAALLLGALLSVSGCGIFKGGKAKTPTVGERVPILLSENEVKVDKSIGDVAVTLPAAEANADWAQPGGSADKSNGQLALGEQLARSWSVRIDGGSNRARLASPPVIADGKLFVVDVAGVVHAYTAATGAALWTTTIHPEKENRASLFGGGVSYDDGKVFAVDGLGDVVALGANDGKEAWRLKPGGPLRGAPTIANDTVYVLSQDNQLFALDEDSGKLQWQQSAALESQGVFGVAAPAASSGSVVAGFSSGELNAYRYENGRVLWQDALSRSSATTSVSSLADIDASPVIDDGRVYAVGQGGRMVALELGTGQRLWEQNLAGIATPWVAGDWLFVVTDDARLVCMARSTGKARWITQLPGFRNVKKRNGPVTWYGPVLAGGRLILTNARGEIVSVSPTDGKRGATIKGSGVFSLPPIVAGGMLVTLDDNGTVTAYR